MAIKFILFAAVLAVARAGLIGAPALAYSHGGPALGYARAAPLAYAAPAQYAHAAPLAYAAPAQYAHAVDTEFDPHPKYSYGYDIQDALTGDSKSQHEERDGDVVRGYYSLVDADGTKRTVEYTADDHNGFNAVVHKEPLVQKVAVAKVAAPLAYAAPVAKYAAPALAYSHGPALGYAHAAPALGYARAAPALAYSHGAPALGYSHGGPALAYNAYH